jgi:hypothetical protein
LLEVGIKVLGTRGVVIDILRDRDGLRKYRLNTNSDSPIAWFLEPGSFLKLKAWA